MKNKKTLYVVSGFLAAGLLAYLIFKPSKATAGTKPPTPTPNPNDGSTTLTCPFGQTACPNGKKCYDPLDWRNIITDPCKDYPFIIF